MMATSVGVEFAVQTIDVKQLEKVILNLEKRGEFFKANLLGDNDVGDPSI